MRRFDRERRRLGRDPRPKDQPPPPTVVVDGRQVLQVLDLSNPVCRAIYKSRVGWDPELVRAGELYELLYLTPSKSKPN